MRKKAIPRIRVKARITSKVREKDLREKAELLMDDYELILPECAAECVPCPFKKTRIRLEKIHRFKDDPAKLAKFAKRGDRLARAYAATIGLVHEEKTPYLAPAKYPAGTITFALRGKTNREKLIGVQNFDSPKWRVLSVLDLVQRRGLHFYSWDDSFVCTGRRAAPPVEYVKEAAESVGATREDGDGYLCPHDPTSGTHAVFDWTTAKKRIVLCEQCAVRAKNTLKALGEGMAVPRVLDEFEVSVKMPLETVSGRDDLKDLLDRPISKELLDDYAGGKIGDKELIDKHLEEAKESVRGETMKVFVKGSSSFGDDLEAFVAAMTDDAVEAKAIRGLLRRVKTPVVVDAGDSVNKLMTAYWHEHGKDALEALVPEDVAERHFKDDEESLRSPMRLIGSAVREARATEVSSNIPKYIRLSKYSEFADMVVRAYKTKGARATISILDSDTSSDHRIRSMIHSFNLAMGVTTKSWKYTDEEKEYGKHLQSYAKKLLDSSGREEHHAAFEEYLRQAGVADELKRA